MAATKRLQDRGERLANQFLDRHHRKPKERRSLKSDQALKASALILNASKFPSRAHFARFWCTPRKLGCKSREISYVSLTYHWVAA